MNYEKKILIMNVSIEIKEQIRQNEFRETCLLVNITKIDKDELWQLFLKTRQRLNEVEVDYSNEIQQHVIKNTIK